LLKLLINGQKISTAVLTDNLGFGKFFFDPKRSSTNRAMLMKKSFIHATALCNSRAG
jgi:hypothetical protein